MLRIALIAGILLVVPAAPAADQAAPSSSMFADSCRQLATAMSLQGDAQKRFVEECVRAKENVNKNAPAGPFEPAPAC